MSSGTENLDWTARVHSTLSHSLRMAFYQYHRHGINVGAQSYWNASYDVDAQKDFDYDFGWIYGINR